jgi:hypothetical protein
MPENTEKSNAASGTKPADASRGGVNVSTEPGKQTCGDDVRPKGELDGKSDSGPVPDVHGREIPPQD